MINSKKKCLPLLFLAALPILFLPACEDELSECETSELTNLDETVIVGPRFRVEIVDPQGAPVEDATVRIEFWKLHCEGHDSSHFVEEGPTGANGVFSTELQPVYNTFHFGNSGDFLTVQVAVLRGGWIENSQRLFSYYQLSNLSKKYSDPNSMERVLIDVYQLTYDGS